MIDIEFIDISEISPSPENDRIYGAIDTSDIDLINLTEDMIYNGVREPLTLSSDYFIISGHRRYAAAKEAGLEEVPCIVTNQERGDYSDEEWLLELRSHNHSRHKDEQVRLREAALDIDPALAYEELTRLPSERPAVQGELALPPEIKRRHSISNRRRAFADAIIKAVDSLKDYWPLTVRQVHYNLVSMGGVMTNTSNGKQRSEYGNNAASYNALTRIMTTMRLSGEIPWVAIMDETRPTYGTAYPADTAEFIDRAASSLFYGYRRDLQRNQPRHVEFVAEKMTLSNIARPICHEHTIPMTVGRGFSSLGPRYEMVQRFLKSGKRELVVIVASDLDPDGETIAQSFGRSLRDDFDVDARVVKAMVRDEHIGRFNLPQSFEKAKKGSPTYPQFVAAHGEYIYECEALHPQHIETLIREAIHAQMDLEILEQDIAQCKQDAIQLATIKSGVKDYILEATLSL